MARQETSRSGCYSLLNRAKEAYKDVPIIIGGIEASLRRLAHYDYWEDGQAFNSMDSRADLLIYGMGERAIVEVAEALESGLAIKDITWIGAPLIGQNWKKTFQRNKSTSSFPHIRS